MSPARRGAAFVGVPRAVFAVSAPLVSPHAAGYSWAAVVGRGHGAGVAAAVAAGGAVGRAAAVGRPAAGRPAPEGGAGRAECRRMGQRPPPEAACQ